MEHTKLKYPKPEYCSYCDMITNHCENKIFKTKSALIFYINYGIKHNKKKKEMQLIDNVNDTSIIPNNIETTAENLAAKALLQLRREV